MEFNKNESISDQNSRKFRFVNIIKVHTHNNTSKSRCFMCDIRI